MKPAVSENSSERFARQHEKGSGIEEKQKIFILLFLVIPVKIFIRLSGIICLLDRQLDDRGTVYSPFLHFIFFRFSTRFSSLPAINSRYHIEVLHNNSLKMNSLQDLILLGLTLASSANREKKNRRHHRYGG